MVFIVLHSSAFLKYKEHFTFRKTKLHMKLLLGDQEFRTLQIARAMPFFKRSEHMRKDYKHNSQTLKVVSSTLSNVYREISFPFLYPFGRLDTKQARWFPVLQY